ncbi:heterokaryon incompatibility protein-domain-containing protein [Immersiella caudata]|uniref:Heterokaryon incompatibility protein-domain-containing protein n=1 Tax=Immersiella caudata TaxID=314043 RepID=A0AA39WEL7_9PEZI|nr:heterokaryon incompatibility protein-domain-containing protein [Immersiella caudata]
MNIFNAFLPKAEPETFSYAPLPHDRAIRLLHLIPDRTQLHGFSLVLQAADLGNAPKFCALSYTWQSAVVTNPEELEPDYHGGTIAKVPVLCNGKQLEINENAFDFLRRMFSCGSFRADKRENTQPGGVNHVWIDSICINQADAHDRSHQVSLMGDIYFKCSGTTVWLGKEEADPGTKFVIETFIPKFLELHKKKGNQLAAMPSSCSHPDMEAELGKDVCEKWRKYHLLFFTFLARRRWFSRGWVVQEVILKSIFKLDRILLLCGMSCGTSCFSAPWKSLNGFLAALSQLSWSRELADQLFRQPSTKQWRTPFTIVLQNASSFVLLEQLVLENWEGTKTSAIIQNKQDPANDTERAYALIFEFVIRMRDRHFADRRDHIYGCYGMIARTLKPDIPNRLLVPNYLLSDADVYIRTAWNLVRNMARLDVLNHADRPSRKDIPELPSWVPNFSRFHKAKLIEMRLISGPRVDASQRRTPHSAVRVTKQNGLVLKGARLSSIAEKGPRLGNALNVEWFLQVFTQHQHHRPTNEKSEEALSRTMLANPSVWDTPNQSHAEQFRDWWAFKLAARINALEREQKGSSVAVTDCLKTLGQRSEWFPSLDEVMAATKAGGERSKSSPAYAVQTAYNKLLWPTRAMFLSSDGYFGFATYETEPDDEMWILEGGRTPFILRPRATGGYQLIGDAYVHGVMHGEAMTEEFVGRIEPVTIV